MSSKYVNQEQRAALEKVIREAGALLRSYWPGRESKDGLDIEKKQDGSLVTKADFASNEIIIAGLQRIFPEDGILSEEIPASPDLAEKKRVWVLDPLDGTKSFVDGEDDFSILVGLVEHGKPVFGMMYFPERDFFGTAAEGMSALVDSRALKVSQSTELRSQCLYLRHCDYAVGDAKYPNWMDSGLALLSVAQGTFDGMIIKLVHHKEWDLVAPSVFIQEAGGRVSDEHGNPLVYCTRPFDYQYFVASNGLIHDQLLGMIKGS